MTSPDKKLNELYELIENIEIAMLTTRRADGRLVSRPMATQKPDAMADLWFVTDRSTHKLEEIQANPDVNVAYYDGSTREWVSVSGRASISSDRARIRALWKPDWKMWFGDEGGANDGGPDDPRIVLLLVEAESAMYARKTMSRPAALFEMARAFIKGDEPEVLRTEKVEGARASRN